MTKKYIILMALSILLSGGTGYMVRTCIDMVNEINNASSSSISANAEYTMVACNDNTAILVKNGEVEGDTFVSANVIDIRINNDMVEWFDGYTWHSVALVEELSAKDKFKLASEKLEQFENAYQAEASLEGMVDSETVSFFVGDLGQLKEEQSSWEVANKVVSNSTQATTAKPVATTAAPKPVATTAAPTVAPTQPPTTTAAPTVAPTAAPVQQPQAPAPEENHEDDREEETPPQTEAPTPPPTEAPTPPPTEAPAPTEPETEETKGSADDDDDSDNGGDAEDVTPAETEPSPGDGGFEEIID